MEDSSAQASDLTKVKPEFDILATDKQNLWLDQGFTWLLRFIACSTVALLFWLSWIIFQNAQPAIQKYGLGFLWGQDWDVANLSFGALPYIYGTLVSSGLALLLAVPVGLAVALVTSEDFYRPGCDRLWHF